MKKLFKKIVSLFYTPAVIENDKRYKLELIRGLVFINKQEIETTSSFYDYLETIFYGENVDYILFTEEDFDFKSRISAHKSKLQFTSTLASYYVYNLNLDIFTEFKLCKKELITLFGCIPETIYCELIFKKP